MSPGNQEPPLADLGYRVSAKKAQLCETKVTYLGYNIEGGQRTLSSSRVQAILAIPQPPQRDRSGNSWERWATAGCGYYASLK